MSMIDSFEDILSIYGRVIRRRPLTLLATVIVYATLAAFFAYYTEKVVNVRSRLEHAKATLFDVADTVLVNDKDPKTLAKSLRLAFNSVNRESQGALFEYGYINVLEDYLVHLRKDTDGQKSQFAPAVLALVDTELAEEPFSKLRPEQRRILVNVSKAVATSNTDMAQLNLAELNDVLRLGNEALDEAKAQAAWSLPLGIVGLVITIIFGITSVLRPLSYRRLAEAVRDSLKHSRE